MNTIEDFLIMIDNVLKSKKFKGCSLPIYRGHSKSDYNLLPTLLRESKKLKQKSWLFENNLYSDFVALAGPRVSYKSSWEELYSMRHEGIPTRLLDWTEYLGTALFFAMDSHELNNPHIWILNPFNLNKKDESTGNFLLNPEQDLPQYSETYVQKIYKPGMRLHKMPLAVYPKRSNERLFAQRGLFTIHGTLEKPLEETCPDCVEKILIPEILIPKIKNLLQKFGINKYTVYPDLKGLCDYLKELYGY